MKKVLTMLPSGLLLFAVVHANPLLPASSLDQSILLGANPYYTVGLSANYANYMPVDTVGAMASTGARATRTSASATPPSVARASPFQWRSISDGTVLRNPTNDSSLAWFDTNAIGDQLTDDGLDSGLADAEGTAPLAIIPEPASFVLFSLLCLGLIRRRC